MKSQRASQAVVPHAPIRACWREPEKRAADIRSWEATETSSGETSSVLDGMQAANGTVAAAM